MDLALVETLSLGVPNIKPLKRFLGYPQDIGDGFDITDARELTWNQINILNIDDENVMSEADGIEKTTCPTGTSSLKYYREDKEFAYASTPREEYNAIKFLLTLPAAENLAEDQATCLICSRSFIKENEEDGEVHEIALTLPRCGHHFGADCLFRYLNPCDDIKGSGPSRTNCPLCRTQLFPDCDFADTMLQLEARLQIMDRAFKHIGLQHAPAPEQERSDLWQFVSLWRFGQKAGEREQAWERGKAQYQARLRVMVSVEEFFQVIPMSLEASCREGIYGFAANVRLGEEGEEGDLRNFLDREKKVKVIRDGNRVLLLRDEAYAAFEKCGFPFRDLELIPFLPF
ncbi:MAG: hypothetical protein Q9170_002804 [Blastenia crenularia]